METKLKVYLASGWFTPEQRKILDEVESLLFRYSNLEVYSPRLKKQFTSGSKPTREMCEEIFNNNIKAINNSNFVVASTEGKDMGTLIEIGAASVLKKPVIAVYFSENPFNLMAEGTSIGGVARNIKQLNYILDTIAVFGLEGYLKTFANKFRYQGLIE
jgi:nucleoside 2-deoxyribosyltransferase